MRLRDRRLTVSSLGWLGAVSTGVLVVASGFDLTVVAVATPFVAFFVLAALLSSPTHRADLHRRRTTIAATRNLTALVRDCAVLDVAAAADRVAVSLTEALDLRGCWFEPGAAGPDLPELTDDGDVTSRVTRRLEGGLVLPPLTALTVRRGGSAIGRFVLESDPAVGLSVERRILAVAMAQLVGLTPAHPAAPPVGLVDQGGLSGSGRDG